MHIPPLEWEKECSFPKYVFYFYINEGNRDYGETWRDFFQEENFEDKISSLYEELQPLYKELHSYVRRKLKQFYKTVQFPSTGHIPAHLLGINAHFLIKFLFLDPNLEILQNAEIPTT